MCLHSFRNNHYNTILGVTGAFKKMQLFPAPMYAFVLYCLSGTIQWMWNVEILLGIAQDCSMINISKNSLESILCTLSWAKISLSKKKKNRNIRNTFPKSLRIKVGFDIFLKNSVENANYSILCNSDIFYSFLINAISGPVLYSQRKFYDSRKVNQFLSKEGID